MTFYCFTPFGHRLVIRTYNTEDIGLLQMGVFIASIGMDLCDPRERFLAATEKVGEKQLNNAVFILQKH